MIYVPKYNAVVHAGVSADVEAGALSAISGARRVRGRLVIPADLHSQRVARLLGLPALSPIVSGDYKWPILPGRSPYRHQRVMASFHTLHPRSINTSEMGTGKTLSVLWAADWLMEQGEIERSLIVAPLSTLERVWANEIHQNFLGRRKPVVVYGDRSGRLSALQRRDADFYIINHDGVGIGSQRSGRGLSNGPLVEEILSREDIGLVILDEASAYKDPSAVRTRLIRRVTEKKKYVWLLTGTPTPNAPTDAYSLCRIRDPQYPVSERAYRDRTMFQVSKFIWKPKPASEVTVRDSLRPVVCFRRDDCIDLPPLVHSLRDVPLSKQQIELLQEIKKRMLVVMKDGSRVEAISEAALRSKMLQICCGAVYDANHVAHRIPNEGRLNVMKEVIEESDHKVLIFAPFRSAVEGLSWELRKTWAVEVVTGDTPAGQRNDIFRRFENETAPHVIVADPRTMSHGLSLIAASTIIWYGPTDSAETYEQANARMARPGQTHKMAVVKLAATATEREIYRRLDERISLQGAVLNLINEEFR